MKDSGGAFGLTENLLFLLVMDALRIRYWLLKQLQEECLLKNVRDIPENFQQNDQGLPTEEISQPQIVSLSNAIR